MKTNIIYNADSRDISKLLSNDIHIQTTITSPPYYDMKDYGVEGQIGYGQKYENYLKDIKSVFEQVYQFTNNDGTLWIVIDTFKRNGSIVPLPFDLARSITEIGWLFQDIIIWKKDKTVPWSNNGFTQRKFEYILFFSKSKQCKIHKDNVRVFDTNHLKKWWVKYPERYNPKGKALDEIWEFPIPVQGSWGNQYIRHFCPLPKAMVSNMIQISTDEGDIVFDPFAGTGTVLSQSAYMNRKYIGFELNASYINRFKEYLDESIEQGKKEYQSLLDDADQKIFFNKILQLRALKYGRLLIKKIQNETGVFAKVFVEQLDYTDNQQKVNYSIITKERLIVDSVIYDIIKQSPFSKFEIETKIDYLDSVPDGQFFYYSLTNSHSYLKGVNANDTKVRVISSIMVDLNEKDYE